ncbi:MAG: PAS domain S-box protein [Burkholderiaceae bacterium]
MEPAEPGHPLGTERPGFDERALFRSLFLSYPDSLIVVDQSGTIVLANAHAQALLGYTVEEMIGMNVDVLVPAAARPRHAAHRESYGHAPVARPMGSQMDLTARRKDGIQVVVEIALSPLQHLGLPFVVAAIRDVGAYPRVQQALRRARYSEHLAQFGRLAVDARDSQVLLDHVPAIAAEALQVPAAMVVLLEESRSGFRVASGVGLVAGEEVGAYIASGPETSPGFLLAQGQPVTIADYRQEQRFVVPQAYLDAGLTSALAVPLYDRGRIIGTLAVRSREPMRFGDEELRFLGSLASLLSTSLQRAQTEEALGHAQRLESIGQLTGGIAHDFNNLLTVIQGNFQALEEIPALARDPHAQQLLGAAGRASRRAAELTGRLLAFSRSQVLQPMHVDPGAMLHALANMLRRTLDQHIQIAVDVPDGCPPVLADPVQLESALLSIAINARDAMPDGGKLGFVAEPCDALPDRVRRALDKRGANDERYVAIRISDTGTGMSREVKDRAFEPFFTTKEAGRGTGLGLSTVYGFMRQSKGAVWIDSEPGKGTRVSLYIPRPWDDDTPTERDSVAPRALPRGLKVLLVEDDIEVRRVVQSFLDALGCKTSTAANGEQALMALEPHERFDLLLTDIALGPGMRGTELARQAQARLPKLAILLMSGFSAELLAADRDAPAHWELLPKPFTRPALAQALANALFAPGLTDRTPS